MKLSDKKRILVTAALPYANGRLHVGHIAGAYLPADIYCRFLRLTGRECVYICGSDENGAPITFAADKAGVNPQDIVDKYHTLMKNAFERLGVSFSLYSRTHIDKHAEVAGKWFLKLLENGHISTQTTQQVYCTECQQFLPDRYIEGVCPLCKAPGARGDQCESCGKPVDAVQLGNPECMLCKSKGLPSHGHIEVKETLHWYLQLQNFQESLRKYIDSHPEWRDTTKSFSYRMLDEGLQERCITRDLDWGIPVPLKEGNGKVLYVWFDAPIGYVTFTRVFRIHREAGGMERVLAK